MIGVTNSSAVGFDDVIRKRALTIQEASEDSGLSVPYLRLRIKDHTLPCVRFGRAVRILVDDWEEFLSKGVK